MPPLLAEFQSCAPAESIRHKAVVRLEGASTASVEVYLMPTSLGDTSRRIVVDSGHIQLDRPTPLHHWRLIVQSGLST